MPVIKTAPLYGGGGLFQRTLLKAALNKGQGAWRTSEKKHIPEVGMYWNYISGNSREGRKEKRSDIQISFGADTKATYFTSHILHGKMSWTIRLTFNSIIIDLLSSMQCCYSRHTFNQNLCLDLQVGFVTGETIPLLSAIDI